MICIFLICSLKTDLAGQQHRQITAETEQLVPGEGRCVPCVFYFKLCRFVKETYLHESED